ncbi:hypothetical protein HMPREF9005_0074 [Actinomyces sp. oral taxon 178 str. F0338]|nr:hypothetical protein HMPREF9005_0074 [Actinomyces sp. oral taxon 178 str. F0338]
MTVIFSIFRHFCTNWARDVLILDRLRGLPLGAHPINVDVE